MPTHLNGAVPVPREYQKSIAQSVLEKGSTLVVLPTGMGKTLIALMVTDRMLEKGRVLFLAPTRPLAAQHEKTCKDWLNLKEGEISSVSGLIPAKKRPKIYESSAKIIISTPQTIANDLKHNRIKWDFGLVIFDEVHRAVGKYAYTKVAQAAKENNALVLGLTASPGAQEKRIKEVMDALGIENVEVRVREDLDVKKYVMPLEIEWIGVKLTPEIMRIKKVLEAMIWERARTLRRMGYKGSMGSKKGLAQIREKILASESRFKYAAISHHASLFSLVHLLELLETQGVEAARRFIVKIRERKESKAQKRILYDHRFAAIEEKLKKCKEHPKLGKLIEIIKKRPDGEKFIVFSQYRDQVMVLVSAFMKAGLRAEAFMGKKDGITQKAQTKTIQDFREGKFDILAATSIGEEGLDIPSVDNVIFYEPVPSEIRAIQRRGRAGRAKLGRMIGLVAEGTRDVAFFWAARRREEKMKQIVRKLSLKEEKAGEEKKESPPSDKKSEKQTTITDFG
ncbi:MAG: DEAD/DEAH box helicase family protein [Candidatus Micrarchaeota archaeon]